MNLNPEDIFFQILEKDFLDNAGLWTRESDAIWRIYAPQKDGVRVTSTPKELLYALSTATGNGSNFIGKVKYYTKEKLTQTLNDFKLIKRLKTNSNDIDFAMTLLMKRIPFKHEN